MLRRRNLIVLRLCRDTQLPELLVQILHVRADALLDDAKVVILHLLSLGRRCAKKSAPCKHQVFSLQVEILVYEEIFLLRTHAGCDLGSLCVSKQFYDAQRLFAQRLHGAQQRRLLVKRLACVGAERCRNAEDHAAARFLQKCRRGDVPRCIPSCLECRAESARGK